MHSHKLNEYISQIWDQNLLVRAQDLENGTDITYRDVIVPWTLENIRKYCPFSWPSFFAFRF